MFGVAGDAKPREPSIGKRSTFPVLNKHADRHHDERNADAAHHPDPAALLCLSQAAFAQELTSAQRDACMGDYEKYCKSVVPGGGRIIACLAKESDKLTPACKKVLEAAEKK